VRERTKRQGDSETEQKSTQKETERGNRIKEREIGNRKMAAHSYTCGVNQRRSQLKREKGEGAHKKTER